MLIGDLGSSGSGKGSFWGLGFKVQGNSLSDAWGPALKAECSILQGFIGLRVQDIGCGVQCLVLGLGPSLGHTLK